MNIEFEYKICDDTPPTIQMFTAGRQTHLGSFEVGPDGLYSFRFVLHDGYYTEAFLRLVASKLESLNIPWIVEIRTTLMGLPE